MKRTDLSFLVFGIGAFAEIVVLVLTILVGIRSTALLYLLAVGAAVALGSFALYLGESLVDSNASSH